MKNFIISLFVLLSGSLQGYSQGVSLSDPQFFGSDSCCYIQSVGLDANNFAVIYGSNSGTKAVPGKIENSVLTYGETTLVSHGMITFNKDWTTTCNESVDNCPTIDGEVKLKEGIQDIPMKVLRMSSTSFLIFYEDDLDPDKNVVVIGTLVDGAIVLSNEFTFGTNGVVGVNCLDVFKVSDSEFVIVFNDDSNESLETDNQIGAIVGALTSSPTENIEFSQFYPLTAQGNDAVNLSVAKVSETQFVVTYIDRTNGSQGKYAVGTIINNGIVYSSIETFCAKDLSGVKAIGLSNNRFVINYGVDSSELFGSDYGYTVVGTVVGTELDARVDFSNEFIFNPAGCSNYDMDGIALGDDAFLLFWANGDMDDADRISVGKIDYDTNQEIEIVFENKVDKTLPEIAYSGVSLLDRQNIVFAYQDRSTEKRKGACSFVSCESLIPELVSIGLVNVDKSLDSYVKVYPSVTSGIVNVTVEAENGGNQSGEIKVFNLASKCIVTQEITIGSNQVDLAGLSTGIYVFSIKVGNKFFTEKVVLQGS